MTYASGATITSNSTRTGYTYVNTLITGATATGARDVIVESKYMDDTMISGLTGTYGFQVTTLTDVMGSYKRYLISWT